MTGAFIITLVPGTGWQQKEPLQVLRSWEPQMGARARGCWPQQGSDQIEPGIRDPGREDPLPHLRIVGAGMMQEPQVWGLSTGSKLFTEAGAFPPKCATEGPSTCCWDKQP